MRKWAVCISAGLIAGLPASAAVAASLKTGRSVAVEPGGYVRPLGRSRHMQNHPRRAERGHGHYAALVGDPGSGLGFYSLPYGYRVGAWRYHQREARYPNAVQYAVAADAARYYGSFPAATGYRYGVFDPNDGVGTPFFAGYYGPAGGYDAPPTPLGRPYP